MNILSLSFEGDVLKYGVFSEGGLLVVQQGQVAGFRTEHTVGRTLQSVLVRVAATCDENISGLTIDAIALHVAFGGDKFSEPVVVALKTVECLNSMICEAPMHIPPLLELISSCFRDLPGCPVVLFFETSFFVGLPECERLYAINPDLQTGFGLRRYGYHGIFHEAACASLMCDSVRSERIISICLEPHAEIAAVVAGSPVMVSGGATPLEGLPGDTSSGEIDSGLLLSLSRMERWGPEQINTLLTQRSGLTGLVGSSVTLPDVMLSEQENVRLAREVMQYRILRQVGMALAAMNGFDRIVFSGRYARVGREIASWLVPKLPFSEKSETVLWSCFETSLMQIMAAQTLKVMAAVPSACTQEM